MSASPPSCVALVRPAGYQPQTLSHSLVASMTPGATLPSSQAPTPA